MEKHDNVTRLKTVSDPESVHRSCDRCDWEIYRSRELDAALEEAAHWVGLHATPDEQALIAADLKAWQTTWAALQEGKFPPHLMVQLVNEVAAGPVRRLRWEAA